LGNWATGASYIKINDYEYNNSKSFIDSALYDKVIHTHGEHGCVFKEKVYPVKKAEVRDTSGAGDSFMAALVVKYLKTRDIEKSIYFANKCASGVVRKKGVTVI
jgi:sugar/nucleoside kinase (ribokinase family)